MVSKHRQHQWLARALANIAAIVAVSTIFGAKAVEIERRAHLAETPPAATQASIASAR